jgi:hypothetical protein
MSCQDCKKQGRIKLNWMLIVGIELLATTVYGHIVLIKQLIDWISRTF